MKKGIMLLLFNLFLISSLLQGVSASFACGELLNSEFESASWANLRVYYQDFPESFTECQASPEGNKFCCDLSKIVDYGWAVGEVVNAEVFDFKSSLISSPSSLVVSGEGYDVFPIMQTLKAIRINSPSNSVFINTSAIFFNVSSFEGYDKLSYKLLHKNTGDESGGFICSSCDNAEFLLNNLDFGSYELEVSAENSKGWIISEKKVFSVLEFIQFSRSFHCDGCKGSFIPSNTQVEVLLHLNLSHNSEGVLTDFFPREWTPSDSVEEPIQEFSDSHNSISWPITGQYITKSYNLTSPKLFLPKRFTFQSSFESNAFDEDLAFVYWLIKWPFQFIYSSSNVSLSSNSKSPLFNSISPEEPLIIYSDKLPIKLISVFPKDHLDKVFGKLRFIESSKEFDIISNIGNKDIDRILVQIKLNKTELPKANPKVIVINSKTKESFDAQLYNEDKDYVYYEVYMTKKGKIKISVK